MKRIGTNLVRSDSEKGDDKAMPIGLAENPQGRPFQCGTCEWFNDGHCRNRNPRINGKEVKPEWCCNLYDNDNMRVVVR